MTSKRRRQAGFTLVELMVTVAIAAVLGSIAISQMQDYTRRARLSEVVLATNSCKNLIGENYVLLTDAPDAGKWGCEAPVGNTKYAGAIQTNSDGVIRVAIANLDSRLNNRYVYLVPAKADGETPMYTPNDMGNNVATWVCGSDWPLARNALPAGCRAETTPYIRDTDFQ